MDNFVVKAIVLLALPTAVIIGGAYVMAKLAGRQQVTQRLQDNAKPEDRTPLGFRIGGYNLEAVDRHWVALDPDTRKLERRALELDLIFPFLYGGAIAAALLLTWVALDRPFHPAGLILPVAITVVADWTENLVQLTQLRLFDAGGKDGLRSGWIQIASTATTTKLVFFCGSSLLLIGLVVWMVVSGVARRS
jgi:hypothetical protein